MTTLDLSYQCVFHEIRKSLAKLFAIASQSNLEISASLSEYTI